MWSLWMACWGDLCAPHAPSQRGGKSEPFLGAKISHWSLQLSSRCKATKVVVGAVSPDLLCNEASAGIVGVGLCMSKPSIAFNAWLGFLHAVCLPHCAGKFMAGL